MTLHHRVRTATRAAAPLAAVLLAAGALAACSSSSSGGTTTSAEATGSSAAAGLTLVDPWVKSGTTGLDTAMFGTLTNGTDAAVTVVGGSSDVATEVQLHEVVDGMMQQKPDGFEVPAGGTVVLEPGGYHIMLMGLVADLEPGSDVTVDLELSDGTTLPVTGIVKDYAGANEDYGSSGSATSTGDMTGDMSGMDMSSDDATDMAGTSS